MCLMLSPWLCTGNSFNQQQQWLFLADASVTAAPASSPQWLLVVSFNFDGEHRSLQLSQVKVAQDMQMPALL